MLCCHLNLLGRGKWEGPRPQHRSTANNSSLQIRSANRRTREREAWREPFNCANQHMMKERGGSGGTKASTILDSESLNEFPEVCKNSLKHPTNKTEWLKGSARWWVSIRRSQIKCLWQWGRALLSQLPRSGHGKGQWQRQWFRDHINCTYWPRLALPPVSYVCDSKPRFAHSSNGNKNNLHRTQGETAKLPPVRCTCSRACAL